MTGPPSREGHAHTYRPRRYVGQLAAHLGRRGDIEWDDHGGVVIRFDYGSCRLVPTDDGITLTAEGANPAGLERICEVVAGHLERFGAAQGLQVTWS